MVVDTLKEAKQHLRDNWEKGTKCGCCGQLVKLYKRKLNSGVSIFLIGLYQKTVNGDFVHASEVLVGTQSLDYSIAVHWGLIEQDDREIEGRRQSGFWRISEKGKKFVRGQIKVPSHVHLFNNIKVGFSETQTDIRTALSKKFNYEELMNERV